MRILVLGGTWFLGRWTIARLLADGHDVTISHRGVTGLDLFPDAPRVLADRGELARALPPGESWDVVLDVNGYFPAHVDVAVEALRGRAGRYVFVSSVSALQESDAPYSEEGAALLPCTPEQARSPYASEYGVRKAECERRVAASGLPHAIARPGMIFGPHDMTDRIHALLREAQEGRVRVPPDAHLLPLVFVRDAAEALAALATRPDASGPFHLVDPTRPTVTRLFAALARAVGPFEVERAPREEGMLSAFWTREIVVDASRAVKELGLHATPLEDALRETLLAMDA